MIDSDRQLAPICLLPLQQLAWLLLNSILVNRVRQVGAGFCVHGGLTGLTFPSARTRDKPSEQRRSKMRQEVRRTPKGLKTASESALHRHLKTSSVTSVPFVYSCWVPRTAGVSRKSR